MRCKACNTLLNDAELRRKDKETNDYVDLCGACYYASEDARIGFYGDTEIPLEDYLGAVVNNGSED